MSHELHQKLSQFLDNELDFNDALHLLHTLQAQSELHHKLHRYEIVRHALKNDVFLPVDINFSQQVQKKILNQSVDGQPAFERNDRVIQNWFQRPFAWAASLAVIAIITPYTITSLNNEQAKKIEQAKQQQLELAKQHPHSLNTQLSQYLQPSSTDSQNPAQAHTNMTVYPQK